MKIKLMSVGGKKAKKENTRAWERTVEYYAPDMYDLLYCKDESDVINQMNKLHPEIVLILASAIGADMQKGIRIVKSIKKISPGTAVFVCLGMVDNEQEAIDCFSMCGAYKCYPAPVSMDGLFHDMYVALNLE
ncbi:MAG: hypothetical protein HFE78_08350 [Clostridiales bacterium]|nr:hypothetical protein [Clostridiales bacterium]